MRCTGSCPRFSPRDRLIPKKTRGRRPAVTSAVTSAGRRPEPGGQAFLQAVREQRDPPERGYVPGDPTQLHHRRDGDPDQPPGAGEQQQGQRELHQQGGGEAHHESGRAVVKRQVEPGVADQQRAGGDHEEDDDLALVPGCPGGPGEPGQLGDVQAHPCHLPVARGVALGSVRIKIAIQAGQRDTAGGHEHQAEPPATAEPGIHQRVRPVNGGQGAGQLTPLLGGQPA